MATTTLTALLQLLDEGIGDYLTFTTTTNITTDTSVISTDLQKYDGGNPDYFVDWWVYIDGTNNAGVLRKVSAYDTTTGTLTVRGANLSSESGSVTCYLHRFNRENKVRALNRSIEQSSQVLFREIDDRTLVTGNPVPDGHFEDWTSDTVLRFYTTSNATLAKTTTAGVYRGPRGTTSCKVTVSSADGDVRISSNTYPRLLDIMNKNASVYVWAYPSTTDDPAVVIYTIQADGTEQTLTSSTSAPASKWTLLKLETQDINDDLSEVQIRCKVATNNENCYFDNLRLIGRDNREFVLPDSFQNGEVLQVYVQRSGHSDKICDDLMPNDWDRAYGSKYFSDGTYRFIQLPATYGDSRQIRLVGTSPLSTLSSDSGTVEIDGEQLNLITAKASAILYRLEQGPVSGEDVGRYFNQINMWESEYNKLLPLLRMIKPATHMNIPRI